MEIQLFASSYIWLEYIFEASYSKVVTSVSKNLNSLFNPLMRFKFELKLICITETWCSDNSTNHSFKSIHHVINKKSQNILINTQYHQPAGSFNEFEAYLNTFLAKSKITDKKCFLVRDLNLNLIDYQSNAKVRYFLNLIFSIIYFRL